MSTVAAPILVVDDDTDSRMLLTTYLSAEGHHVVEADSGEKALAILAEGPAALVVLDVLLPGLSGFDVCRRIKRDPKTGATPVIMVTSLADTQSRTKAFESDADEFLAKPVFRPELIARVRSMLRLRRVQFDMEAAQRALEAQQRGHLPALLARYLPKADVERLLQLPDAERDALLERALRAALAGAPGTRGPRAPDR